MADSSWQETEGQRADRSWQGTDHASRILCLIAVTIGHQLSALIIHGGLDYGYDGKSGAGGNPDLDRPGSESLDGPHDQGRQDRHSSGRDIGEGLALFDVHPDAVT